MKLKFYLLTIAIIYTFSSCFHDVFKLEENKDREPIINDGFYSFHHNLSELDFKIIDTTSLYVQIFDVLDSNEQDRTNPMILQFHNDGYFKEDSYLYYGNFNYKRNKKSAAYGGKYYLSKNSIFVESFYPTSGSKTKYYEKIC